MIHLGICLAIGFALLLIRSTQGGFDSLDWREASWLAPYLVGLVTLSYLGSFGGGAGLIPVGPDILAVGLLSTCVYILAIRLSLHKDKFALYLAEEELEEIGEYDSAEDAPVESTDFKI